MFSSFYNLFVCYVISVFGKRFGRDDVAMPVLQVEDDALETWCAEHVAVGRWADGIEAHRGEDKPG